MKKSTKSAIIEKILKIFGNKKIFSTEKTANEHIEKSRIKNAKPYKVPKLYSKLSVENELDGFQYYKISGKNNVILYLHGGAFVNRPIIFHWEFLKDISKKTNATIYFPLYPLTPQYHYKDTYKFLLKLYKLILKTHKSENIIIMGDSAGATLSLGLTHLIKRKKLPLPSCVIPLSPSMDIKFSNPKIAEVEPRDPMLAQLGCALICGTWAKGASAKNPLVSPKYVDLDGFPPTYIFAGTNEILYPEIRDFVKMAKEKKAKIYYTEKKEMNHVFPLFPIPEAEEARTKIAEIILKKPLPKIVKLY